MLFVSGGCDVFADAVARTGSALENLAVALHGPASRSISKRTQEHERIRYKHSVVFIVVSAFAESLEASLLHQNLPQRTNNGEDSQYMASAHPQLRALH